MFELVKDVLGHFAINEIILEKCCKDDRWLEAYKHHKHQKAKIKEELLSVTWHPNCVIDWCFYEDEKEVLEYK